MKPAAAEASAVWAVVEVTQHEMRAAMGDLADCPGRDGGVAVVEDTVFRR